MTGLRSLHLSARNSIAMYCIWILRYGFEMVKVSQKLFAASCVVKIMIDSRFRLHMQAQRSSYKSINKQFKLSIQFWRCYLYFQFLWIFVLKSWMVIYLVQLNGFVVPFRCNMASRKVNWMSLPQADSFFSRLHRMRHM